MNIQFSIRCLPIAQPRPRATSGFGGHARIAGFDHRHPITAFKEAIRQAAEKGFPGPLLECPVSVKVVLCFPRPGRLIWKTKPMVREWHDCRPDAENVGKAVLDAITGVIWKDDSQVAHLDIKKFYCAKDETPGVVVNIDVLPEAGKCQS